METSDVELTNESVIKIDSRLSIHDLKLCDFKGSDFRCV